MYVVALHHDRVVSLYDKLSIASDMSEKGRGFSQLKLYSYSYSFRS